MKDLNQMPGEMGKAAKQIERFFQYDAPAVFGTEALNFIDENFQYQGFQGYGGIEEWEERKVVDKKGKDKRYYKRGRRQGRLTRFGEKEKGRAILVGHDSGANHMAGSFHAEESPWTVQITNDKLYAAIHNEGVDDFPERQMIGPSIVLDAAAEAAFDNFFNRILS